MNTPFRPVFGNYSYLPGTAIVSGSKPVPIRTFGTSSSPQPGTSPITPRRVGSLTLSGSSTVSLANRIISGLFG